MWTKCECKQFAYMHELKTMWTRTGVNQSLSASAFNVFQAGEIDAMCVRLIYANLFIINISPSAN